MKILFACSGGGPNGIMEHTGMFKALREFNIVPDHYSGTSAGVIVSAWSSVNNYDIVKMEAFARTLNDNLLDFRPLWYLRQKWLNSIMSNKIIFDTLKANLPLTIPSNLHIWAARCSNLSKVNIADPKLSPDLPTAVLTAMSIHGLWPTVKLLDGNYYTDAGFRFQLPYDKRIFPDYDQVWLLVGSGKPNTFDCNETGLINIARQDISWLVSNSILNVIEEYIDDPRIRLIWPMVDNPDLYFDHSLIDKSYEETKRQIKRIISVDSSNNIRLCKETIVAQYNALRNMSQ